MAVARRLKLSTHTKCLEIMLKDYYNGFGTRVTPLPGAGEAWRITNVPFAKANLVAVDRSRGKGA
jgi:hypothetical protein